MIKSIKVLLCGKNVIYCHLFDKITRIPSGRIVVPSGRIAVPLMGGFLVLEGKAGSLQQKSMTSSATLAKTMKVKPERH